MKYKLSIEKYEDYFEEVVDNFPTLAEFEYLEDMRGFDFKKHLYDNKSIVLVENDNVYIAFKTDKKCWKDDYLDNIFAAFKRSYKENK